MLYRIDQERFLTHMIDHFTRDNLIQIHFCIISAGVKCGGHYGFTVANRERGIGSAARVTELYPPPEVYQIWDEHENKNMIRELYFDHLKQYEDEIYRTIIENILNHVDLCLICKERENDYIDLLCEFLKKKYAIECIDLNKLFIEGECGPFRIDRDEIYNKAVDVRRRAGKKMAEDMERTAKGRAALLKMMKTKEEKIKKLAELGIRVTKAEHKELDKLLVEAWVEED